MSPIGMKKIDKIVKNHQDGTIINLFVTPGAHAIVFPSGINKWRRCIEMKVSSPPKENKANKDVIKTIADFLDKPIKDVYVLNGVKNREKTTPLAATETSLKMITGSLKKHLIPWLKKPNKKKNKVGN